MLTTKTDPVEPDRRAKASATRRRRQIEREEQRAKDRRDRDRERIEREAGAVARRAQRDLASLMANQRSGRGGRTFHLDMPTLRASSRQALIDGLAYDDRDEAHGGKGRNQARRDELEAAGESYGGRTTAEMTSVIEAACDAAGARSNGVAAHRCKMELPITMSTAQRIEVAQGIAQYFEAKGLPCHWAIHLLNAKKEVQPHLHFTVPSRPVRKEPDGTWHGTKPGARGRGKAPPALGKDKATLRKVREDIAAIINRVANRHDVIIAIDDQGYAIPWHGGSFKDVGIDRPAKGRIPYKAYRAREREAERGLEHRPMSAAAQAAEDARAAIDSGDPAEWDRINRERREWAEQQRRDADRRRQDAELKRVEKFYRSKHPAAAVLKDQDRTLRKKAKQKAKEDMEFLDTEAQKKRAIEENIKLRKENAKLLAQLNSAERERDLKEQQRVSTQGEAFDFERKALGLEVDLEAEREARELAERQAKQRIADQAQTIAAQHQWIQAAVAQQEKVQAIVADNTRKTRLTQQGLDFAGDALVALGHPPDHVEAWKSIAWQDEAMAAKIFAAARPMMDKMRQASKARSAGRSGGVER